MDEPIYAEPSDLTEEWLPSVPSNAAALIRYASEMITEETTLARYAVDDDGMPTDPKVRKAFKRATLRQVVLWAKAKIDPEAGTVGQEPIITSQSAGGGSVSYATGITQQEVKAAVDTVCPGARRVLKNAGLISHMPWVG
ncbi:hypothetical protein [Rhodococcoides fascians]|uniref:hypothetical protein n=1 Tax=Rhodococcoides fascians TaxID=1828 RepID=UPI00068E1F4D|nr:hypothetical protein [Rhodococcus fascians]